MSAGSFVALEGALDRGVPVATALVVAASGSTPGRPGMRALVDASGAIEGTIGGGAMEAAVQQAAVASLRGGNPLVVEFVMEGTGGGAPEPICGGRMRILVDPHPAQHREAYVRAAAAQRERRRGILLTSWRGDPRLGVRVSWLNEQEVGEAPAPWDRAQLSDAVSSGETTCLTLEEGARIDRLTMVIEPVRPVPLLVIFGAGHVSQALAHQARLLGFEVAVTDDRAEYLEPARFPPGTILRCGEAGGVREGLPLTRDTYVVLVGRGYQQDLAALAACVRAPVAYLGMIGSRRKVALVKHDLLAAGQASEAELERVQAPIGLDIGAVTVQEIAVSIAAEMVAFRRRSPVRRSFH